MNKSSKNLLAAFVAGVGAGVWAGLEFGRLNRKPAQSFNKKSSKDVEHEEWLQSLKGLTIEQLKEIQKDLLFETGVDAKEIALRRIILAKESEVFSENFKKTSEEIKEAQERTSERIARFRKEMDSNEEI